MLAVSKAFTDEEAAEPVRIVPARAPRYPMPRADGASSAPAAGCAVLHEDSRSTRAAPSARPPSRARSAPSCARAARSAGADAARSRATHRDLQRELPTPPAAPRISARWPAEPADLDATSSVTPPPAARRARIEPAAAAELPRARRCRVGPRCRARSRAPTRVAGALAPRGDRVDRHAKSTPTRRAALPDRRRRAKRTTSRIFQATDHADRLHRRARCSARGSASATRSACARRAARRRSRIARRLRDGAPERAPPTPRARSRRSRPASPAADVARRSARRASRRRGSTPRSAARSR